jgi:hypothetical protein
VSLIRRWKDCLPRPSEKGRLVVSKQMLRVMERENLRYPIDQLVDVPQGEWPAGAKHARVLRSRDFLVQVFQEPNDVLRLSITRAALDPETGRWKDGISWDDVQHLKTLAGYGDKTAIEIYPPDSDVVNVANVRHVWIVPEAPAFMWRRPA